MKEESKIKIFRFIFLILFITYTAIFIMVKLGYYEYSNYTKKVFTEEQIRKFEEDIKNGVALDINEYMVEQKEVITKKQLGTKVSKFIGVCSRKTIEEIFKLLNKVIES